MLERPVYFSLASRVSCRVTASLANAFSRSEYARKRSAMKRCASRLGIGVDPCVSAKSELFDQLVGAGEQFRWDAFAQIKITKCTRALTAFHPAATARLRRPLGECSGAGLL